MKIAIKTLGCKSNRYESDKIFDALRGEHSVFELNEGAKTFSDRFGGDCDILIVNTCTVTHVADRKSRQSIRSFKKMYPDCTVVVFGCGANVSASDYEQMSEVDYLMNNSDDVVELVRTISEEHGDGGCEYGSDIEHGVRTRAVVKIQDGCNNYCTYCIIPRARGPEYSFPSKQIIKEVKEKEVAGFKEIVLTGIIIGRWKEDGKDLADLIEILIENTENVRFRISSIEPECFSDKFFDLFKTGRLCTHMHMSLQSGSDSVLMRMKRNYNTKLYKEVAEKFYKEVPDIGLTTDVIVGFPGESDEEFKKTCDFVKEIGFLKMHVFPYSKREKTAAFYMKDQVNDSIKKKRVKKLMDISEDLAMNFKANLMEKEYEVLVESFENGICKGFTPNYVMVQFEGSEKLLNEFVIVKLIKVLRGGNVLGEMV